MIDNKVKLVIWDLDDTFWQGTLSEEAIAPIARNVDMVRELAGRGIISSICSKNDFAQVKAKLTELGIWDYFVFPVIDFAPKGKAIAEMIETAALRAENVLFIDDNKMNLEEVKFFNEGIMVGHPEDLLEELLEHPNLAGKPDPELTRLKQYQFLQKKAEERSTSVLSNEEFLRASNIRLSFDYDIEKNFDRVVEMINRTNQLNYTKLRLGTPEDVEAFRESLNAFGIYTGCVRAHDNYGDYGLIGFFLMKRTAGVKRLDHFVFSCRVMNMGIEQYIYEMLGKPDIEIVPPVTQPLDAYKAVDWIAVDNGDESGQPAVQGRKLVLLGGCDLLQLASYCSTERSEFVNRVEDESRVRYDDPGFVLTDRGTLRDLGALKGIPCWSYEDAVAFDEALAASEMVLISLWAAMSGSYLVIDDRATVRMTQKQVRRLSRKRADWMSAHAREIEPSTEEKLALVRASLEAIAERSPKTARIFVLGTYSLGDLSNAQAKRRRLYNDWCRDFCAKNAERFAYVDVDAIVPRDSLVDKVHFSRAGYFALARDILDRAPPAQPAQPEPLRAAS
jgi:FkbH-like protein